MTDHDAPEPIERQHDPTMDSEPGFMRLHNRSWGVYLPYLTKTHSDHVVEVRRRDGKVQKVSVHVLWSGSKRGKEFSVCRIVDGGQPKPKTEER